MDPGLSKMMMNEPSMRGFDPMNAPTPPPMEFESISSHELEEDQPHSAGDPQFIKNINAKTGTWRVAHTLKNHNNVKLESPTAPALVFWYAEIEIVLTQAWSALVVLSHLGQPHPSRRPYDQ